jgi:hypothetical protein
MVVALLIYNVLTAGLLAHAGLSLELRGVALWPAVAIHVALAIWSAACVRGARHDVGNSSAGHGIS